MQGCDFAAIGDINFIYNEYEVYRFTHIVAFAKFAYGEEAMVRANRARTEKDIGKMKGVHIQDI